ncbi:Enterochelin esterase OS=Rhodanobacter lindaniclasticus OX=75310 GN=B1991_12110 PE=4 SV=1 [Rhodanobacter lindaniclasticus]
MNHRRHAVAALLSFGLLVGVAQARTDNALAHRFIRVELDAASTQPTSGRLLLFAIAAKAAEAAAKAESDGKSSAVASIDANPFSASPASVAAREVSHWAPGQTVDIDTDRTGYPAGWSQLPPGEYLVQAVLDVNHDYNYGGRGAGDLISAVTKVHLPATQVPTLTLSRALPAAGDPWTAPDSAPQALREGLAAARPHAHLVDFASPALSAFWGRPIHMRGWVLTPPDYEANAAQRYPVVYYTQGFGGSNARVTGTVSSVYAAMAARQMPPMIWVFLDESGPTGTHEFADSVNNGPWGQALTTELIPHLEAHYRMDADVNGRFLNGHSSGGRATLWLQTRYPKNFGGTWSTAPIPATSTISPA